MIASSKQRGMVIAGVMSGTSADGLDVALVRFRTSVTGFPQMKLLEHEAFPYSRTLRAAVLTAMNAQATSTAELARLNWRLGLACAKAIETTLTRHSTRIQLVGMHGQTLYHQSARESYCGERFACTWQAGEASLVAARLGVPVISNFRPADMAAGGQGAPLVPLLDQAFFAHARRGRVLQNIGGIANLTAIPAGGEGSLVAFDTGPGNMVIDTLMQQLYGRAFDRNGAVAGRGRVLDDVLANSLDHPFFRMKPPRTAGREQFGREYADALLELCRKRSRRDEDAIATATALTAHSIARSYLRFAAPGMTGSPVDYVISGGGARNGTLMRLLASLLQSAGCRITTSDALGMPAVAKEAVAFALLAWQTWHHLPGNVPRATGAERPAILGQISYV